MILTVASMSFYILAEPKDIYASPNCIETATDLLSLIFCDEGKWIDYYVYELNFGESYQPGMVERADGTEIPLETVEDLYNLLTKGVDGQSANSESK